MALDKQFPESPVGSWLGVASDNGHVTIQGLVSSKVDYSSLSEELRRIQGVTSVIDETVRIPASYGE